MRLALVLLFAGCATEAQQRTETALQACLDRHVEEEPCEELARRYEADQAERRQRAARATAAAANGVADAYRAKAEALRN